jgi:hypothetical protein
MLETQQYLISSAAAKLAGCGASTLRAATAKGHLHAAAAFVDVDGRIMAYGYREVDIRSWVRRGGARPVGRPRADARA